VGEPEAGTPKQRRRVAPSAAGGAKTTNAGVPPTRIIILDKPFQEDDAFTLTSSFKEKSQTKKTSESKPLDATHKQILFAVKANSRKDKDGRSRTYALVQTRSNKSGHTIFTDQPFKGLPIKNETAPEQRAKQYNPVHFHAPPASDVDLQANTLDYDAIVVKEPLID
jgi:hypothetical protein